MFTGIVEELGTVASIERTAGGARITVAAATVMDDVEPGASMAVNGCCLTVIDHGPGWWAADVVPESLDRTSLGALGPGERVNLERPVQPNGRLGGHIVQGHIDGTTTISAVTPLADGSFRFRIALQPAWARYVCEKGSIAIDGISLTVAAASRTDFEISVIPHTLDVTNLGARSTGDRVNVEVDVVAKYIERLLAGGGREPGAGVPNTRQVPA